MRYLNNQNMARKTLVFLVLAVGLYFAYSVLRSVFFPPSGPTAEEYFKAGSDNLNFKDGLDELTPEQANQGIHNFEKVVFLNPGKAEAWYELANLYRLKAIDERNPQLFRQALHAINRATELNPADAGYWLIKSGMLDELKRGQESTPDFQVFLFLKPELQSLFLNLTNLHLARLACAEERIRLDRHPTGMLQMGKAHILEDLGRYREAIKIYEQLKTAHYESPFMGEADLELAICDAYEKMGNDAQALQHFEKYEAIASKQGDGLQKEPIRSSDYGFVRKGDILRRLGRPKEARAVYGRILAENNKYLQTHPLAEPAYFYEQTQLLLKSGLISDSTMGRRVDSELKNWYDSSPAEKLAMQQRVRALLRVSK